MERGAHDQPQGLAHEPGADEGGGDDQQLVARGGVPEGVDHVGQEVGGDGQADHQPDPRRGPGDEAQPVAADHRRRREEDDEEVEQVHCGLTGRADGRR